MVSDDEKELEKLKKDENKQMKVIKNFVEYCIGIKLNLFILFFMCQICTINYK